MLYDFFFFTRFAFHLRLWWLEGRGITCHQQIAQRPTEKHYPIRVLCQPAGLSDKVGCTPVRFFFVLVMYMYVHLLYLVNNMFLKQSTLNTLFCLQKMESGIACHLKCIAQKTLKVYCSPGHTT